MDPVIVVPPPVRMSELPLAALGPVNPHQGSWQHWGWKHIEPIEDEV